MALLVLVGLRGMQWLTIGPLLHDPEWLQFGRLARELSTGRADLLLHPRELFPHWSYMHFAQGTVVVSVVAWLLSPLLGLSSWTLQASSLLAEALAVGLLAALLAVTTSSSWRTALGLAPWILAPGFAVVWQMLPFGNHTELQWVPLGVALFLAWRPPERRPWWHFGLPLALLLWGMFCYRGTLPAVGALALCGLWSRSRRFALGGLSVAGLTLALMVGLLLAIYGAPFLERWWAMLFVVQPGGHLGVAAPWIGEQVLSFPTAPRDLPIWPYLSLLLFGLGLALAAGLRGRPPHTPALHARRYVALWALLAFGAILADSFPNAAHCLPALYALLTASALLLASGVARPLRAAGVGVTALLALAGLRDGLATIQPSAWPASFGYEGYTLYERLDLRSVDPDDLPWFQRIVDEGRADPGVGVATHGQCGHQLRGRTGLPHPRPLEGVCGCEEPGQIGHLLTRFVEGPPNADPWQVGRGAWIFCNRDMQALERGLEGVSEALRDPILAGARAEQEAQADPPPGS